MTTRTPWRRGALAALLLTLGLPMTAAAQGPAVTLPLDREITLPGSTPRELLELLQRQRVPFQFDLRITMRCTDAQCSTVVRPSDQPGSPERLALCLADCRTPGEAGYCATACKSIYGR